MEKLEEKVAELTEEIKKLTSRLEAKLSQSNPVSVKCEAVLAGTPRCYDFTGSRRWAACRAWQVSEEEKTGWQEGISRAWRELKEKCTWD